MPSPNKDQVAAACAANLIGLTGHRISTCGEGGRGELRRADVLTMMERCRQRGVDCALAEWSKGEYGYAELTYGHPEAVSRSVKNGWRIGEDDNMSLAYTYLALDLLAALGGLQG